MPTRLLLALTAALLIVRLPSLVQPMGPDQGLYAYVGERILHGQLAYRDAWDQKPPGIHYVYAALRAISPHDAVVPAADLAAAALVAVILWGIGAHLGGPIADVAWIAIGGSIVPMTRFAVFWRGGALDDLYQSTVRYNLLYSGETYRGRWDMVRYLFTFPIQHARIDALWFAGGLGCLSLLIAGLRRRMSLIPVV